MKEKTSFKKTNIKFQKQKLIKQRLIIAFWLSNNGSMKSKKKKWNYNQMNFWLIIEYDLIY
jgi:hypothetical protein